MPNDKEHFLGIDVSKDKLDVAIHEEKVRTAEGALQSHSGRASSGTMTHTVQRNECFKNSSVRSQAKVAAARSYSGRSSSMNQ